MALVLIFFSQTNILIDSQGRACLADFGLSLVKTKTATVLKIPPKLLGTARWMSPEHVTYGNATKYSDIYSFGMLCMRYVDDRPTALAFRCLLIHVASCKIFTGAPPFADTPDDMLRTIICDEEIRPLRPTDPHVMNRGLDDGLWAIMIKSWDQEPKSRQTAAEIADTLGLLCSDVERPVKGDPTIVPGLHVANIRADFGNTSSPTAVDPMDRAIEPESLSCLSCRRLDTDDGSTTNQAPPWEVAKLIRLSMQTPGIQGATKRARSDTRASDIAFVLALYLLISESSSPTLVTMKLKGPTHNRRQLSIFGQSELHEYNSAELRYGFVGLFVHLQKKLIGYFPSSLHHELSGFAVRPGAQRRRSKSWKTPGIEAAPYPTTPTAKRSFEIRHDKHRHSTLSSTRTLASAVDLPPELFGPILYYVATTPSGHEMPHIRGHDKQTLMACSLVCVFWANRCRLVLFRGLTLRSVEDIRRFSSSCTALSQSLSRIIPIAQCLDVLHIVQDWQVPNSWVNFADLQRDLKLTRHGRPPVQLELEVRSMSSPYTSQLSAPGHVRSMHWGLPKSLPSTFRPPSVLSLRDTEFSSLASLMHPISENALLRNLRCWNLSWLSERSPAALWPRRLKSLRNITCGGSPDDVLLSLLFTYPLPREWKFGHSFNLYSMNLTLLLRSSIPFIIASWLIPCRGWKSYLIVLSPTGGRVIVSCSSSNSFEPS